MRAMGKKQAILFVFLTIAILKISRRRVGNGLFRYCVTAQEGMEEGCKGEEANISPK